MHTREEMEELVRSGPGTLMGNLLRRYWTPACLSSEISEPDSPPVRVPLLGERLVAFRDSTDRVALVEEACPHRGASLFFGRNEERGIRCVYHGWKFDKDGNCLEQPSERRSFAEQIHLTSYPTHESGGIVWAYLGPPETMTPFRDFGTETLPEAEVWATKQQINCNWVQSFDGDLDGVHVSWLHAYFAMADIEDDGTDRPGYPSNLMGSRLRWHDRAPRLELEEEWFGFRYATLRDTPNGNTHARVYAFVMPYTSILAGVPLNTRQIMIVPRDDFSCWRFQFATQVLHNPHGYGGPAYQADPGYPFERGERAQSASNRFGRGGVIDPAYSLENNYEIDRDAQRTTSFTGIPNFRAHDVMVTESMGPIYDRTREHWGTTDIALIKMHAQLLQAAHNLAEGKEPPASSTIGPSAEPRRSSLSGRTGDPSAPTPTSQFAKSPNSRADLRASSGGSSPRAAERSLSVWT